MDLELGETSYGLTLTVPSAAKPLPDAVPDTGLWWTRFLDSF